MLRPKRQVTLPKKICDQLGIEPGDALQLIVENSTLIARPRKTVALEALREVQKAFQYSGITEEELQEEGRRIRQKVTRGHYSIKA
jgi:AbrB family looped-hinge helix DNA binding protein